MYRYKTYRIFNLEQSLGSLFLNNRTNWTHKNTCQLPTTATFSVKANESFLTSSTRHGFGQETAQIKEKDKEYLVKLNADPDTFGLQQKDEFEDEGDIQEERFFTEQPLPSQKLRTKSYADIIKNLIRKRKIKEAIDVLEIRMLKQDKVKPPSYIYNLLLGACGRVGYTKKAFMLYNDMKRRGLRAMGGTYTALFNACANSPWPSTDGLTRARSLRQIMIEKGDEPNETTYNAMIKAFGRGGDLQTAFFIVDEMASKKFPITSDVITFLLQACITDKETGFRHALLIWRKLIDKNIKPTIYNYNMFLRTIRDCGLGDIETTKDVISRIVSQDEKDQLLLNSENPKTAEIGNTDSFHPNELSLSTPDRVLEDNTNNSQNKLEGSMEPARDCLVMEPQANIDYLRPNLMATVPHLGSLISLEEVVKPEDRLLLVGGFKGFLENMSHNDCKPDIKSFTQLLDCLPKSLLAEQELLLLLKKHNVKPDLDFYNMLMKKRSMRCDYDGAKVVLELMKTFQYRPNLVTYGVLAMGCKTIDNCRELVEEMKSHNYQLNKEILGSMLYQACSHTDTKYVLHLMELCLAEGVNPDKKFLEKLDEFKKKIKYLYDNKELTDRQSKLFRIFKLRNKTWREQVHIDETEDIHPWQQYRQINETAVAGNFLKDSARFKSKHQSLFKVKKFAKVRK